MHFLAKTICHETQSQQVKRCVYIDTGVCNMYRLYTHFTKFADRNNSAEGCVYMACVCICRNVIRSYILEAHTHMHLYPLMPMRVPVTRGLLGAWPEALQWMVLSMTLSIFNKWTLGWAQSGTFFVANLMCCWWKLQSEAFCFLSTFAETMLGT